MQRNLVNSIPFPSTEREKKNLLLTFSCMSHGCCSICLIVCTSPKKIWNEDERKTIIMVEIRFGIGAPMLISRCHGGLYTKENCIAHLHSVPINGIFGLDPKIVLPTAYRCEQRTLIPQGNLGNTVCMVNYAQWMPKVLRLVIESTENILWFFIITIYNQLIIQKLMLKPPLFLTLPEPPTSLVSNHYIFHSWISV